MSDPLLTFGVTVDDNDKPRVRPAQIPEFCYKKAAQVNSDSIDFVIREENKVVDWYHTHSDEEPLFHNTVLMEEALLNYGVQTTLDESQFIVLARAGHFANVILPFFFNDNAEGTFEFTWKHGILRTVNPVNKIRTLYVTVKEETQRTNEGHLIEDFLTQGKPTGNPLIVGKKKNYAVNNIVYGPIHVTISKEVDCHINRELGEIKTTRKETFYSTKFLEIFVKCYALGGIRGLVCATINGGRLNKVKMVHLGGEYVDCVAEITHSLLHFILKSLQASLTNLDAATGIVETKNIGGELFVVVRTKEINRLRRFTYKEMNWQTSSRYLETYQPNWIIPTVDSSGRVTPTFPW